MFRVFGNAFPHFTRTMDPLRMLIDIRATDTDCSTVVTEFTGDINGSITGCSALHHAVLRSFSLTIAALGARGDVDPDVRDRWGSSVL